MARGKGLGRVGKGREGKTGEAFARPKQSKSKGEGRAVDGLINFPGFALGFQQ